MHPRNRHQDRYDLEKLSQIEPQLSTRLITSYGETTIDFSDPKAVKLLNSALLKSWYKLKFWELPEPFLCPPVPGRADYIHYVSDLFESRTRLCVLDIGTGANLIYPIIGHFEYDWTFTAADVNKSALANAQKIITENRLENVIKLRHQPASHNIFINVIEESDVFDLTICNPPFHESPEAAQEGTNRKWRNLGKKKSVSALNFGGVSQELWYPGGEVAFVGKMIEESKAFAKNVKIFSCLISKEKNLAPLEKAIQKIGARATITSYGHGNKKTRILSWTYKV